MLAFALGDRLVVDKPPSVDEVRPKVVIRGKEFFVTEHYPKDASRKLEYDKNLIKELVAHKWARWLHNPCRLGGPHRFRAGGKIRSGPQVGKVAR